MINTRLNELQGYRTSYLVNAKTVAGEAVIKLDRDCDGQVARDEAVLVLRDSAQPESWRPLKSVAELSQFLETTPEKLRGQNLGLWRDKGRFFLASADGKIQNREVTPIAGPPSSSADWTLRGGKPRVAHAETLWSTEKFHHMSEQMHDEYDVPEFTAYHYTKIDPARVNVASLETPAGTVATFNEGLVVSRTHVEQVTCFARDGQNWVPMGFKDMDFRGYLD
jgi:hypothetical protein